MGGNGQTKGGTDTKDVAGLKGVVDTKSLGDPKGLGDSKVPANTKGLGDATGLSAREQEEQIVVMELSLQEAQSLRDWLMRPLADGTTGLDEPGVKGAMAKLTAELDFVEAVASVRMELEQAGLTARALTDAQVAQLGRRISSTSAQRLR